MKKTLLKILSMLMALTLVFGMSACSKEGTDSKKEDTIVGKWKCEMAFSEFMGDAMEETEETLQYFDFTGIKITMYTEYKADGTYSTYLTEEEVEAFADDLKEMMTDGMTDYFEDIIEQSGQDVTIDDFLEDMLVGMGYDSIGEMIDEAVELMLDEQGVAAFNEEGYYVVEGDKLYMSDEADIDTTEVDASTFVLDGDELTIEDPSLTITLEFKRVK